MKKKTFQPKDGRNAISVSSIEEIRQYMGEIMGRGMGKIEIVDNLVITYLDGLPITLGTLI